MEAPGLFDVRLVLMVWKVWPRYREHLQRYLFGERLVKEVVDPDGAALTTTREYLQ